METEVVRAFNAEVRCCYNIILYFKKKCHLIEGNIDMIAKIRRVFYGAKTDYNVF